MPSAAQDLWLMAAVVDGAARVLFPEHCDLLHGQWGCVPTQAEPSLTGVPPALTAVPSWYPLSTL